MSATSRLSLTHSPSACEPFDPFNIKYHTCSSPLLLTNIFDTAHIPSAYMDRPDQVWARFAYALQSVHQPLVQFTTDPFNRSMRIILDAYSGFYEQEECHF